MAGQLEMPPPSSKWIVGGNRSTDLRVGWTGERNEREQGDHVRSKNTGSLGYR